MDVPKDFLAMSPEEWERIREDIAFARALRNMEVVTTSGSIQIQFERGSRNAILDLRKLTASGQPDNNQLPSQAGNGGLVLGTDGTSLSFVSAGAKFNTNMQRGTNQTFGNGSNVAVIFNQTVENDQGIWSASTPTRLTIPPAAPGATYAGRWMFSAFITWNTNGTGGRLLYVAKNGSTQAIANYQAVGGSGTITPVGAWSTMAAGDYFELFGQQNSGGALDILAAQLTIIRIGD